MPLNINHVLGSRLEPSFSEKIHRLEHRNAVDEVRLSSAELERHQLLTTTQGGQELAIALPRHQRLFDGAVLLLDDAQAIVVRTAVSDGFASSRVRSVTRSNSAITSAIWVGECGLRAKFCS